MNLPSADVVTEPMLFIAVPSSTSVTTRRLAAFPLSDSLRRRRQQPTRPMPARR